MKSKILFLFFLTLFTLVFISVDVQAQCAMCRGSLESSVSEGSNNLAAGINKGILYLLSMPYLIMAIIAYLWYRSSKANQEKMQKIYQRLKLRPQG
ncbi:MAG: hypothetical protein MUE81_01200 [Thermoflexibacter sp.]|nr:hypothetical protein [Thermoflexibacter sp.]